MLNTVTLTGKIIFEPEDKTKKHINQSSWKKMAMVLFNGDAAEYYAWYVAKRYNLILNKPLRGAHISFINDSIKDMMIDNKSIEDVNALWEEVKGRWDKKKIDVVLSVDPRTDGRTWWLNVPEEARTELQSIRNELGLGRPFFGMHMTIGYANERNIDHSTYIHTLIKKGFIKT